MNPEPFRHWLLPEPQEEIVRVRDLTGVGDLFAESATWRIEPGQHVSLSTGANSVNGHWLRFTALVFLNSWLPDWGGLVELWGEHDTSPAVSYVPVKGRTLLLEYGDKHWWGLPVPVRGPDTLLFRQISFYSHRIPEGATAPHAGFVHPKGALTR